jgi:hypothetical protein
MNYDTIYVTRTVSVSRERLWTVLEVHASYHVWGPWSEASLTREGASHNGVGAVRRLRVDRRTVVIEQIVAFIPPTHLSYVLLSGLPLRDYRADVTLTALPNARTSVQWQARYRPKIQGSGWLIRMRLKRVFNDVIERLASRARALAFVPHD